MKEDGYTLCDACEQTMEPGGDCAAGLILVIPTGKFVKRIPMEMGEGDCHDCNAGPGRIHHLGCDWERCPHCGGQMLGCADIVSPEGFIEVKVRENA